MCKLYAKMLTKTDKYTNEKENILVSMKQEVLLILNVGII